MEQSSIKDKLDRAVRARDNRKVNIAKEHQALVVRARLKRMSCEVTNMAQELRAEELRHAADRHIASVTSPDGQRRTTNEAICKEFRQHFVTFFTREPELSRAQSDTYLADFLRLSATEVAGCEGCITEDEVRKAMKLVGLDKFPGIDGLPY